MLRFHFVTQNVNFLAHNIIHWANFCMWDGSLIIFSLPSWVFIPEDRDGRDLPLFILLINYLFTYKNLKGGKKKKKVLISRFAWNMVSMWIFMHVRIVWQWYDFLFLFFDKVTFFNWHIYHFFLLFYFNLNLYIAFTIPVSCGGILASTNQEFSGQNTCIARTQRQVGLELETTNLCHGSISS